VPRLERFGAMRRLERFGRGFGVDGGSIVILGKYRDLLPRGVVML
jgi:hypothetical protein